MWAQSKRKVNHMFKRDEKRLGGTHKEDSDRKEGVVCREVLPSPSPNWERRSGTVNDQEATWPDRADFSALIER
jgi:hypothetical protein